MDEDGRSDAVHDASSSHGDIADETTATFHGSSSHDTGDAPSHRAKAFILNPETNDWDEMATGICAPDPSEDGTVFAVRLRSEEDPAMVIFTAHFHKDQDIGIQNDTVLTWTTLDADEAALSFENVNGCEEFWRLICRFQGRPNDYVPPNVMTDDKENSEPSDDESDGEEPVFHPNSRPGSYDFFEDTPGSAVEISIPERPEMDNLEEIEDSFHQALMVPILRRRVAQVVLDYKYIPALLDIFRHCEEFGMLPELARLFRIFKCIFLFNSQDVLKELLCEQHHLSVAGVFEFDPSFAEGKPDFRQYLGDKSRFKQVIPIGNQDVLALIHQSFRLQYFKDVILARILDEEASASFMLIIRLNHMAIINALDNDPSVIDVMRTLLQSRQMAFKAQLEVLRFFKEFLSIARTVTLRRTLQIYQPEMMGEFLCFLNMVLHERGDWSGGEDERLLVELRLLSVELLINFIQHDAAAVRSFMLQHDRASASNLLTTIIDLFVALSTPSPIRWQIATALRILLDTFNPAASMGALPTAMNSGNNVGFMTMTAAGSPQLLSQALSQKSTEEFLNFFYPEYACRLLAPIIDLDKTVFPLQTSGSSSRSYHLSARLPETLAEILFHLGELLCSFIGQHKYRIKYLVLRNLVLQNTQLLLQCREKHLQLTGLRVLRTTLAVGEEFYQRFFIQHRSFVPIFTLYRQAGGVRVDNLVTSAVLDLFEFVRVSKPVNHDLIRHLATFHRADLQELQPESVFRGILDVEERIERGMSSVSFTEDELSLSLSTADVGTRAISNERAEEDYFSTIDEDEHAVSDHDKNDVSALDLPDIVFKTGAGDSDDDDDDDFPFMRQQNRSSPSLVDDDTVMDSVRGNESSPTKKTRL